MDRPLVHVRALLFLLLVGCTGHTSPRRPNPESPVTATRAVAFEPRQLPSLERQLVAALEPEPEAAPDERSCRHLPDGEPRGIHRNDGVASGRVVLTFDDGPYPDKTPVVLDRLAFHGFTATFFVLGRHLHRGSYDLIQRMEAEGHIIASHSYDHDIRMANGGSDEAAIAYIRGQHETTRALIEVALMARSPDDFDAIYTRVIGASPERRLPRSFLERGWPAMVERHRHLLVERGHPGGRYPVIHSRPPGGGPYLGPAARPRARYDAALVRLGMLNVMWHAQSGDVDPDHARDSRRLRRNMLGAARRGGVLLIHDFIRHDALTAALADIAESPEVEVIGLEEALIAKYDCPDPAALFARAVERQSTRRSRSESEMPLLAMNSRATWLSP